MAVPLLGALECMNLRVNTMHRYVTQILIVSNTNSENRDAQWMVIEPLLPKNQPRARRTDDRRVISGIVHVLKTGCRWQDCPSIYDPSTTIYNRFRRWTMLEYPY